MTRSPSPTATPRPTTITTTRYTIDRFNLTYALSTDAVSVSVGAQPQPWGDAAGTLVATAVLVKSCANPDDLPDLVYRPSRVDLLMASRDSQPSRTGIADFFVVLFADDGSEEHNPGVQVHSLACVCGARPSEGGDGAPLPTACLPALPAACTAHRAVVSDGVADHDPGFVVPAVACRGGVAQPERLDVLLGGRGSRDDAVADDAGRRAVQRGSLGGR